MIEALTTEYYIHTGNIPGADGFDWPGSATSPCCSSCTIAAQTVNLFYWPTPAIPSQATSFVSDGYTYVSPSVYLGFTSLSAFDYCGTVGNVYTSTTFSFAPDELSTFGSPLASTYVTTDIYTDYTSGVSTTTHTETNSYAGPASVINYRDLGQNCSTISGYEFVAGNPSQAGGVSKFFYLLTSLNKWLTVCSAYDPCHPTILLPPQVKSIDPAWASCANNLIGGFYDPPYALTSQGALQAFSSSTAAPAQTPQSDQAPSTTTTPAQLTSTPASPADPTTQPSSTADPSPPVTSDPTPPVESSSTPQPALPATSDPADPSDPATSDPAPVQPTSTPTQETGAPSPSTTPQVPPVIASQTLTPGGPPVTVSGTVLSLDPSGSSVVIGGSTTLPLSAVISPTQTPIVVGSQTLSAGGSPITVSGTVLSLDPSGSSVVVNGVSTVPLTAIVPSKSAVVIGSQTIQPGGSPITVSGAVFSLEPSGGGVVVNGVSTFPASSLEAEISSIISAPAVLGTQTLVPGGPPVTIGGTTYSLQPTGSNVIVNGASTIPLSSANAAISSAVDGAIGSAIASIIGASPTATTVIGGSTFVLEGSSTVPIASATGNSSSPVQFTGNASRAVIGIELASIALLGFLSGIMLIM